MYEKYIKRVLGFLLSLLGIIILSPMLLFYPIIKMKTNYKLVWLFMGLIICIIMLYAFDASDYFTFLMNSWKVPKSL